MKKTLVVVFLSLLIYSQNTFASCLNIGRSNTKIVNGNSLNMHGLKKPAYMNNLSLLNLKQENTKVEGIGFKSAFKIGGTAVTQIGGTAVDSIGNIYIAGGFTGTINIGGKTFTSSNGYDVFVAKFDSSNNFIWGRVANGAVNIPDSLSIDGATCIALDNDGNVYIGGSFVKTLNFKNGNGNVVQNLSDGRNDNNLNFEMFVAKYTTDGKFLWAEGGNSSSVGDPNDLAAGLNTVSDIVFDFDGYPYIVGSYSGKDFLGKKVSEVGGSDCLLASLAKDGSGAYWESLTGTPDNDFGMSVTADSYGDLNLLGVIGKGKVTMPDTTVSYTNDTGRNDTFISGYDINGIWYFAIAIGSGDYVVGNSLATAKNGDMFLTGFFKGTSTLDSNFTLKADSNNTDGFIVRSDLNGNIIWARQFGYSNVESNRIVVDDDNNSYVMGTFIGKITFAKGESNEVTLTTQSARDQFIAKYDSSGNFQWAKQIPGTGEESYDLIARANVPYRTFPLDMIYSPNDKGKLYITGDFSGSILFDNISLTSDNQARYGFVSKLSLSSPATSVNNKVIVKDFSLLQNYPNPFNPSTKIAFTLPEHSNVQLSLYNVLGQEVKQLVSNDLNAGAHTYNLNASNLASGVYMYRLTAKGEDGKQYVQTKKLMLLK